MTRFGWNERICEELLKMIVKAQIKKFPCSRIGALQDWIDLPTDSQT